MKHALNTIASFLIGITPFIAILGLGTFTYSSYPNILVIATTVILAILAVKLGITIYKKAQKVGAMELIFYPASSPDLDNLDPEPTSNTVKREAKELVDLINKKKNLFKRGSIRIYGDWLGKAYSEEHTIVAASFDDKLDLLTLDFKNGKKLEVYEPKNIFESPSFLKIVDANRVKLFKQNYVNKNVYYLDYKKESKNINIDTNLESSAYDNDPSVGKQALMISAVR